MESKKNSQNSQKLILTRKAARLTDRILQTTLLYLKEGVAEKEAANHIVRLTKKYGCALSFPPIVAFGRWAAYPHHRSDRRRLRRGDPVLIDLGAKYRGYCADLTRMFVCDPPSPKLVKLVKLVRQTQALASRKIKAGMDYREADQLVRDYLQKHDVAEKFIRHGLGHGTGRKVHVNFTLSARLAHPKGVHRHTLRAHKAQKTGRLKVGDIFTLEPGVYIKGWGGARIEDTVVLTHQGVRELTRFPKKIKLIPS